VLKNTIFPKKRADIWWYGIAVPPYIRFFFTKKYFLNALLFVDSTYRQVIIINAGGLREISSAVGDIQG
jgi:hypothetical protein